MQNKSIALFSGLLVLLSLVTNSCSWEPTPEAIRMMGELETTFSKINEQLPVPGEEVEFGPSSPLEDVGMLGDRDSYRVFLAEDIELIAVAEGRYDYDSLNKKGDLWLTTAQLTVFDEKPSLGRPNYYDFDHERDVNMVYNAHHMGVFRTVERVDGEYHGTSVDIPSTYVGWFFLVDLQKAEVVAAARIEAENDEEFYGYEGENPLTENLYDNIIWAANKKINEWAGSEGVFYFQYFDPNDPD
jgi:hypothetical protein